MKCNRLENLNRLLNPDSPEPILLVDDEPRLCHGIQQILASVGLESAAVHSVAAAKEALKQKAYCLVLLDLNMPGARGTALIDYINQQKIDTGVIVVSGEKELKTAVEVIKNGARDYIKKPFNPDELLIAIKNALENRRLETENRQILEELKRSEALHRFIVHNSPDLLYIVDHSGCFTFINNNVTKLLGYARKEVIGKHFSDFVYSEDHSRARKFFRAKSYPTGDKCIELRLKTKSGDTPIHVEVRAAQVNKNFVGGYKLNDPGCSRQEDFVGYYGVARDITDKKRAEEIIRFQHNHDLLTGLPNRNLLNEQVMVLLNHARRSNEKLAIFYIDIDRFKLVNDTYGQTVGDRLLQFVAEKLKSCTRESDVLARLGGDEFIILLPDIHSPKDASEVARKIVSAAAQPFVYGKSEIYISLSIGISLYPDHGNNWQLLLKKADTAVCNSRSAANKDYCFYNDSLKNYNSSKIYIENLVRTAIKEKRLVAHYQPQIDLKTGQIHAIEALARIESCDHGLILPGKFIEIAEESSLICDLGEAFLDRVCDDLINWQTAGHGVNVSLNISAIQLAMASFSDSFLNKIYSCGLAPEQFELEITENVIIKNLEMTLNNIIKLTKLGVNIAVDDFGKGYSSLSYLDQLPLKTLKLDMSFIHKVQSAESENSIIPAMLNVSNGLKLNFVVEGVENRAQHDYLLEQGSCIAQGYYYSKPINGTETLLLLKNHQPFAAQVGAQTN